MFRELAAKKTVQLGLYAYVRAFAWYIRNPESAFLAKLLRLILQRDAWRVRERDEYRVNTLWLCLCIARGRIHGVIKQDTPWQRLTTAGKQECSAFLGSRLPTTVIKQIVEFSPSHRFPEHAALLLQLKKLEAIVSRSLKYWWRRSPETHEAMQDKVAPCLENTVSANTRAPNVPWDRGLVRRVYEGTGIASHRWLNDTFKATMENICLSALGHNLLANGCSLAAHSFKSGDELIINPQGATEPYSRYNAGELAEVWYTANTAYKAVIVRDLMAEEAIRLQAAAARREQQDRVRAAPPSDRCQRAIDDLKQCQREAAEAVPSGMRVSQHPSSHILKLSMELVLRLRHKQAGADSPRVRVPLGQLRGTSLDNVLRRHQDVFGQATGAVWVV